MIRDQKLVRNNKVGVIKEVDIEEMEEKWKSNGREMEEKWKRNLLRRTFKA